MSVRTRRSEDKASASTLMTRTVLHIRAPHAEVTLCGAALDAVVSTTGHREHRTWWQQRHRAQECGACLGGERTLLEQMAGAPVTASKWKTLAVSPKVYAYRGGRT